MQRRLDGVFFLEDQMSDRKPTPVKLDASKIESFKTAGHNPAAEGCTINPGEHYNEGWQVCWGGQTFECRGGAWVNIHKSC
jgi:hypothetical protein